MDRTEEYPESGSELSCQRDGAVDHSGSPDKLSNEALTSEDLEEAFAIAALGVWRWDLDTDRFHWSAEIFSITGRDQRTFIPNLARMLECIHPDDRALVHEGLSEATESHRSAGREFRVVRPDGSERYCWAKIRPISQGDRVVAMRGILLDLTEKRRSEFALRMSEERYRDTIELSPQMPWTADPDGNILSVNAWWSVMTGQPKQTALGAGWLDQLYFEDVSSVRAGVAASLASGQPLDVKARLKCATGELRWIRARAFPKIDHNGQILRWYGLTEDVHDQEQALLALREGEEHYRCTLELNPQIPWTADPAGNILEAGPLWRELMEPAPQEWFVAVHPDDSPSTLERWSLCLQTGERLDVRYRLRQADGGYRWFRARAGARRSSAGVILRWYGLLEDIHDQVNAEAALRLREDWIRQAHEAAGVGLFEVDFDQGVTRLSNQSLVLHDLPADSKANFPGESWSTLVRPEDGVRAWAAIEKAVATDGAYNVTFGVPLSTGEMRWINGLGRVEYHSDGRPHRLLGINFDVTARQAAEASLKESEALNRSIVNASADGIKLISASGEVLFANDACSPALEIEAGEELIGRDWVKLWPVTAQPRVRAALEQAIMGNMGRFIAPRATARDRPKWWDVVVSPVLNEGDKPLQLVTIARDITEQKAAEDRIQWSATHDPLTHLPNRRLFEERLAAAVDEAEARGRSVGLLMIDVDHFKQVNDTLGHDAGDAILRTIGDRLCAANHSGDTVARLGGDEFAVILRDLDDSSDLERLVEAVIPRLREPFAFAGNTLDCRASIGGSIFPRDGKTPEDLLKSADLALYAAKSGARGRMQLFNQGMRSELEKRVRMLAKARWALDEQRLIPFYQPKVDLRTGLVVGYEALARLIDHKGKSHLPSTIASAFDDPDLSIAITDRMLSQVVSDIKGWLSRGIDPGHVAINASSGDFRDASFADRLLKRLAGAELEPRLIQLEVTETVFLGGEAGRVEDMLNTLNKKGILIALDDFGTGFASLSHLKQFPVDTIKIDRSFIQNLAGDPDDRAIVSAIAGLGMSLSMDVVAEGIENEAQLKFVRAAGCGIGQGYLFGKAVPAEQVPLVPSTMDIVK